MQLQYILAATGLYVGAVGCSTSAMAEKVTALVSFIEIQSHKDGTKISYRQPRSIRVTIKDEHEVEEWSARQADKPNQHSLSYKSVLGAQTDVEKVKVEWRFETRNTLVRETSFPTFREIIRLNFRSGVCDGEVSYALNTGIFRFGMWDLNSRKPISFEHLSANGVKCILDEENVS
ncbi:hypothetical protein [Methylobacterium aerolatum]|uniref:Lipoprotein n=1 Tax=Methylobacterium aerolatum TaxID=418708 RepID=A0ABU0I197_9HYPH|nr:hypothetical protein [Methylobacterium aerolatum]MDQ0448368.1 hypothetical protein [Methylobacterium aerolatum]